jgi:1-acyl-sn-glycerol-3-phosphate acyltransferase
MMTDATTRPISIKVEGDATADGERATLTLNGAAVPRERRLTKRSEAAAPSSGRRRRTPQPELRDRVASLHEAVTIELERRRDSAGLEPADSVPISIKQLSSLTREMPRLAGEAPRLLGSAGRALTEGAAIDAVRGIVDFVARQRELAARPASDPTRLDDFGFDREWTESLLPFFAFLYRNYWRVRVEGLEENIPAKGRALLVSNHAGVLPYDGAMIRTAIFEDHPAHRHARALILNVFFGVPVLSWFLRRTGNTLAHPDDTQRLLEQEELVLVFPEGANGTGKPYSDRYRLRRFGRGGFVSVALRTGAPLIPVSVVGSEEVHPMLANLTPVAKAMGIPYFPITPTFPLLGPLGVLPLPSSWIIRFHPPIAVAEHGPDSADDPALVLRLTDQVRDTIQSGLYTLLEERGSVFA